MHCRRLAGSRGERFDEIFGRLIYDNQSVIIARCLAITTFNACVQLANVFNHFHRSGNCVTRPATILRRCFTDLVASLQ